MKIAKQGPTNLYDSEIYRSLERQAYKEGFFTPSDKDIVKQASNNVKIASKVNDRMSTANLQPSENVDIDISMLVDGLRNRGYISQAQDVENNYIMFKKAETEYYNLSMETPNDLMDFAHPDGDINVTDIKGELADIETIQSAADKILAVVRKQPSGKLAALAGLIKKNAQNEAVDDATKLQAAYEDFAVLLQGFDFKIEDRSKLTITPENLLTGDYLNIYCQLNGLKADVVTNAFNKLQPLKQIGFSKFTKDEFETYIKSNHSDKNGAMAGLLGLDPSIFNGVSSYIIRDQKGNEKPYNAADFAQGVTINWPKETLPENKNSPYSQIFTVSNINNGFLFPELAQGDVQLTAVGFVINQTKLQPILTALENAANNLFNIVSPQKIDGVNKRIEEEANKILASVQDCSKLCVVPADSIKDNIIDGNTAFSNIYQAINKATHILTKIPNNVSVINNILKLGNPTIATTVTEFITSLNTKASSVVTNLLRTEMKDITSYLNNLVKARDLWDLRKDNEKSTKIINEYLSSLQNIIPKGSTEKPVRLVRKFLKSKGYENLEDFQADIDNLIAIATPSSNVRGKQ
jgi:hypothetical protein